MGSRTQSLGICPHPSAEGQIIIHFTDGTHVHSARLAVESRLLLFVLCYHYYSEHSPSSLSADLYPYFSSNKHRLDGSQGHVRLKIPPRNEKHKILLTVHTPAALSEDPRAHQHLTFVSRQYY